MRLAQLRERITQKDLELATERSKVVDRQKDVHTQVDHDYKPNVERNI